MIVIVDYGMGNLGSIQNMLVRIGSDGEISSDPAVIRSAEKLILPGVGAFDAAVRNLQRGGLWEALDEAVVQRAVPIFGICLGMQLMMQGSDEGDLPGFGWIPGRAHRFRFDPQPGQLRVPHMGWNQLQLEQEHPLFDDMVPDHRFYFVHSYHVLCDDPTHVLATTRYGRSFHSAVVRDHIVGAQFHPEKSHRFGMGLISRFAEV
jgi:glutamine amidotransferase